MDTYKKGQLRTRQSRAETRPEKPARIRRERRDAIENRERVLAAARQLFAAQGVEATSMNEIAQVAHVGVGTLYRRFAHKGELCFALLWDDIERFQQLITAQFEMSRETRSAIEQMDFLFRELIKMTITHIPLLSAMQEASSGLRRNEIYQSPFYVWLHQQIIDLLRPAIQEQQLKECNTILVADTLLASVAPPLLAYQIEVRGLELSQITNNIRQLYIEGLRR
jgi:AcrR family transcriptional regulator